ncbi:hypothetical protein ABKN59_007648 [Abortiporus biennis]
MRNESRCIALDIFRKALHGTVCLTPIRCGVGGFWGSPQNAKLAGQLLSHLLVLNFQTFVFIFTTHDHFFRD